MHAITIQRQDIIKSYIQHTTQQLQQLSITTSSETYAASLIMFGNQINSMCSCNNQESFETIKSIIQSVECMHACNLINSISFDDSDGFVLLVQEEGSYLGVITP